MRNVEILDCTFRDGGYYTNWDFDGNLVNRYLASLETLGVRLVEIGFFSRNVKDYRGSHYYSRAGLINRMSIPSEIKLGVMINAAEFSYFNTDAELQNFLSLLDKRLSFVRLACHHHELETMRIVIPVLNQLGFDVGINLMKMETASDEVLAQFVSISNDYEVKWLYLADSFGSCTPQFVTTRFKYLRELGWSGSMGFHSHDNCGLAMANVFGAIDGDVQLIDSTILGMGRGPGNVKTEQLIAALYLLEEPIASSLDGFLALYELVEEYFLPLQKQKKWGASIPYSVSAIKRIHPSFGQEMVRQNYSPASVINSLVRIGKSGSVYDEQILNQFLDVRAEPTAIEEKSLNRVRKKLDGNTVVIVGSGDAQCSLTQLEQLKNRNSFVIGLNVPTALDPKICDLLTVSQPVRFDQVSEFIADRLEMPVLTPSTIAKEADDPRFIPYGLEGAQEVDIDSRGCRIPEPLVVGYALSFALSCKPKSIILIGVSGFGLDQEEHRRTQTLLKAIHQTVLGLGITLRTVGSNSFDLPEINLDLLDEIS